MKLTSNISKRTRLAFLIGLSVWCFLSIGISAFAIDADAFLTERESASQLFERIALGRGWIPNWDTRDPPILRSGSFQIKIYADSDSHDQKLDATVNELGLRVADMVAVIPELTLTASKSRSSLSPISSSTPPVTAISIELPGPVFYAARVTLDQTTMNVDGKTVNLTPGMAATVEIKTGKRKLIEFLLSPLMRMTQEAGRER
jgi:hypothetical protein